MKITIATLNDQVFSLEVADDMELVNFKALCEMETEIPVHEMVIMWNGRPILGGPQATLKELGLNDGEMILIQRMAGGAPTNVPAPPRPNAASGANPFNIDFGSILVPGGSGRGNNHPPQRPPQPAAQQDQDNPAVIREMLLASPHETALLKERNPKLAEALLSGSLEKFTEVLAQQRKERSEREREVIQLMNADPFDSAAQQRIAEEIRLKNVESNMETAMEYAPESFGQVVMLYIDCHVNGHPVKAFVDSGAQMTIMSQACAERCGIMRLVDVRWAGIAKGVGTQKIIGRVHLGQIQIGNDFLHASFSILENQPMDMLLGLDMLKRHQCCIDLKQNKLVIATTGTSTRFLAESELPEHAKLSYQHGENENEDMALAEALAKSAEDAAKMSTNQPGTSSSSRAGPSAQFPEKDIQKILSQGFTREQAVTELQRTGGIVEKALAALFARSIKVPKLN